MWARFLVSGCSFPVSYCWPSAFIPFQKVSNYNCLNALLFLIFTFFGRSSWFGMSASIFLVAKCSKSIHKVHSTYKFFDFAGEFPDDLDSRIIYMKNYER